METLIKKIEDNYINNSYKLSFDKQFHLLSRLFLFTKEKKYYKKILKLKNEYIGINSEQTRDILKDIVENYEDKAIANDPIRSNLLAQYPNISKFNRILFKWWFTLNIYGEDISDDVLEFINKRDLIENYNKLSTDYSLILKLSSVGINYMYLTKIFYKFKYNIKFDFPILLLTNHINTKESDSTDLKLTKLKTYALTHIVIGESNYYTTGIKVDKRIKEVFNLLKRIVKDNYSQLSLDSKLEYLLCKKIVGLKIDKSPLDKLILDEAYSSYSPSDNIVYDKFNKNSFDKKYTFENSEHRNLLLILLAKTFNPIDSI